MVPTIAADTSNTDSDKRTVEVKFSIVDTSSIPGIVTHMSSMILGVIHPLVGAKH